MSRRQLFDALCAITTALEQEAQRGPCTAHTCVLAGLIAQLDRLIDDVVDSPAPRVWRWLDDEA